MRDQLEKERENCTICEGDGYLPHPDDPETRIRCACTLRALYHHKLGSEVFEAENLDGSPFSDKTGDNLFITSTRRDFLPHLRYSLIDQGLNFFSRITNDSQMLDAWLSKERTRTQEEGNAEEADFTSLRDLVEDPTLLVVFLGVVSYRNRALPGVLLETLRIRSYEGKPTWVVNPHALPFAKGHLCWSNAVEDYLTDNFESHKIQPSTRTKHLSEGIVTSEDGEMSKEAEKSEMSKYMSKYR